MNLKNVSTLANGSLEALMNYDWPGNVRELQNVVERGIIINRNKPVNFDLPREGGTGTQMITEQPTAITQNPRLEDIRPFNDYIKGAIELALKATHGRIEGPFGAAKRLELHPSTLKNKMKKLGISRANYFNMG